MKQIRFAVLSTVSYAAVFRQALTIKQIHFFLIENRTSFVEVKKAVAGLLRKKRLGVIDNRYFLPSHPPHHQQISILDQKYRHALKATQLLSWIPTIQLIGLSGAVATGNPKKSDDIDLFIITRSNCVWISRLCAIVLLEFFGLRRRPQQRRTEDKICLNFFIDRNNLHLPVSDHTLYGAHEVVQMKPLWDKEVYKNFLDKNSWVADFLPNAYTSVWRHVRQQSENTFIRLRAAFLFSLFENPARIIQWWYMRNRRKHEVVDSGIARFHPHTTHTKIMRQYQIIYHRINRR